MIFNDVKDIELDIRSRLSSYLKVNTDISIGMFTSVIWNYLQEMKNIDEIQSFYVSEPDKEDNSFYISFHKDDKGCKFNISLLIEFRNIKIEKIKSNKVVDYKIIS